ncbi:MAG: glycosyltransferase family 1 protein [Sphingobacteriales bacterium]|nr:MAG: glycosyltransferase family 1 protein [Sphingobacteriales bacterium]
MGTSLKIGILGTRGIPNRYGGFEQCAEYLAAGLVAKGHEVWVYNSHNHEYQASEWNGVHIIHCNDPEHKLGTPGQFLYDLNCINDARKRNYDVLLQLGYTSNSIWFWRWPKYCSNVVNMDGLEWKRSKYSKKAQKFLKIAERWAAVHADVLVADSIGIQQYLKEEYKKDSHFIAYGADVFDSPDASVLNTFNLQPYAYDMLIARMEPENNVEAIIKGHLQSGSSKPLIVIGSTGNAFGTYLKDTYGANESIRFAGAIYDIRIINNLRHYSNLYFHGHSVGGTNPSLLEAMGSSTLIVANNNVFNKAVLGNDALYFSNAGELAQVIKDAGDKKSYQSFIDNNIAKIKSQYSWPYIVDRYEEVLLDAAKTFHKKSR